VTDLDGLNWKYNMVRKAVRPAVDGYIAVSMDLAKWLVATVGVAAEHVAQIYNGVDIDRFHPRTEPRASLGPEDFAPPGTFVIGTVGRMAEVKDQLTLVRAFLRLVESDPNLGKVVRLAVIGGGPLREEAQRLLSLAKSEHLAWLPGERSDIPGLMRQFDLFVLPSLREGISNTILEAMASGLPVVATRVGGNPELVEEGETGMLVPPADPDAMAEVIRRYVGDTGMVRRHGLAGRHRVETRFSMDAMVNGYLTVYDTVLSCGENARSPLRGRALQGQA
jgi:sugar transferase (PEP-CTERM/EpsH1 system associated)